MRILFIIAMLLIAGCSESPTGPSENKDSTTEIAECHCVHFRMTQKGMDFYMSFPKAWVNFKLTIQAHHPDETLADWEKTYKGLLPGEIYNKASGWGWDSVRVSSSMIRSGFKVTANRNIEGDWGTFYIKGDSVEGHSDYVEFRR